MIAFLGTLLGKVAPFRDYAYIAVGIGIVTFYNVHVHNLVVAGKAAEVAAVKAASDKVVKAAQAQVDQLIKQHGADVAALEKKYADDAKSADDAHNADLKRLRELADSYRNANAALRSAAVASGKPDSSEGAGSAASVGDLPPGFGVSLGLADALRADDSLLAICRAERESLTGK